MSPPQGRPPERRAAPVHAATHLESDDEIRHALLARRGKAAAPAPEAAAEPEPQPDRPLERPPLGMLCVLDDGQADGEWVRLRADRTVIGRADGDVRIPHDGLLSSRHAEITRQRSAQGYSWLLTDLGSTNGTFVRVSSSVLKHESEVLVGRSRFRFEAAAPSAAAAPVNQGATRAWSNEPGRAPVAALVELGPAGPVQRLALTLAEYWIGRDARACAVARPDDALLNARHARLYRDARGQWHVDNNKSLNGVWLRITEPMTLGGACQFRLGEQRFLFRIP